MTVTQKISRLEKDFKNFRATVNRRLKPIEAYVLSQTTVKEAKKDGYVSISPEAWKLILWLTAIIAAGVGLGNIL